MRLEQLDVEHVVAAGGPTVDSLVTEVSSLQDCLLRVIQRKGRKKR